MELKKLRASFFLLSVFSPLLAFSPSSALAQGEVSVSSANFSEKLESQDFRERRAALDFLSGSKLKNKKELLKKSFSDKDPLVREKAAIALGKVRDAESMTALIANLKSGDQMLRLSSMEGLREFPKNSKAVSAVAGMLSHEDRNTRWKAAEVLGKMKNDLAVDALKKLAQEEKDEYVKKSCIESLYKIGSQKAVLALKELEKSKDEKLSKWAGNVLKVISREKKGMSGKR